MNRAIKLLKDQEDTLELYTKALTKAHKDEHPEVIELRERYLVIKENYENEDIIKEQFEKIVLLTSNFEIPENVCNTYIKTYEMLSVINDEIK